MSEIILRDEVVADDWRVLRPAADEPAIVPAGRVSARRAMRASLMLSAVQQGLTAQDVADLVAFLRSQ